MNMIDTSGRSIKNLLQTTDPFNKGKFRKQDRCFVCREKNSKGRCRMSNATS